MDFAPKNIAQKLCRSHRCIEKRLEGIRKILNVHKTIEILQVVRSDKGHIDNILLTPKGTEVFHLLRKGLTVKEAAHRLNISISAVKRHKENMLFVNKCTTIKELVSKYYGQHATQISIEAINTKKS